jgi:hypothetical protein
MKLLISLTSLLIDSLFAYGKEIIGYFANAGVPELLTSKPYLAAKEAYARMEQGFKKARKNAYTQELQELDAERVQVFKAIRKLVTGYLHSDEEEEVAAAKRIDALLDHFGADFLWLSYAKKTASISKFLSEIKSAEYAPSVAVMRMESKVTKLDTVEGKFERSYTLSVEDKAAHDAVESASDSRREFEQAVRKLMSYLEVKMMEDENPKLEALGRSITAYNTKFEQNEAKGETNKESKP